MKQFLALLALTFSISLSVNANDVRDSDHAKKTLEIYTKLISIPTVKGRGEVPNLAAYLKSEFIAAGFAASDVKIMPLGETTGLVVHYCEDMGLFAKANWRNDGLYHGWRIGGFNFWWLYRRRFSRATT